MEIRLETILNRANAGLALAQRVLAVLQADPAITLNFSDVDRMTPSFANAFVMTVLEAMTAEGMRERITMLERNEQVARAMDESADRFARGLRLTTQQSAAA